MMSEQSTITFTQKEVECAVGEYIRRRLISLRVVPTSFVRRERGKFLFNVGPLEPETTKTAKSRGIE